MSVSRKTVLIILAFFAIYIIWGSTYLLNKISVSQLPPFFLASVRFLIASMIIFIIAKSLGISLSISKKQLLNTTIAGFLFLTMGNGLAVLALKYLDSGFAALEISAQPLVILIMMRVFQGKPIKLMSYIGVVLGFIGIFLLVSQKEIINKEGQILGMILIFVCMLSWAYASIFVGKADLPKNSFVNTGYQMLTGGIMLGIISLVLNESWSLPTTWHPEVQWAMIGLIVFGSIIAFTSFNYLLKEVSPEKVATSTYVNPIIALILGWWVLNEHISLQSIIAAVVLLTGVYFINTKRVLKPRAIGR
ncbi:EamA family transporter [uncultured Algibacter sp.]|uniref:EamA family transporter n=1 Tax=uncultured Algibacter sp. TaxID=298659 RepID=UPI0025F2F66D|nr:EamA family transporter [uncultured Algibacter sp.]MDC1197712.1 EamA family transporter [Algibacter sp.]